MTAKENDNHDKIQAEIAKLIAETARINKNLKWYEIILLISGTLAFSGLIVALTKAFL